MIIFKNLKFVKSFLLNKSTNYMLKAMPLLATISPKLIYLGDKRNFSDRKFPLNTTNIPIYQNAVKFWDEVAIIDEIRSFKYGELCVQSSSLAEKILEVLGNKSQERISFLLPNTALYVISQWAIWKNGHIAVPLHTAHPENQLKYYVEDSKSSLLITTKDLASKFSTFLSGQEVIELEDSFLNELKDDDLYLKKRIISTGYHKSKDKNSVFKNSPAMIIYTSGTTGPPKGVVLTHGNLQAQVQCMLTAWKWRSNDVLLHCLPLHHVHGIVNALMCPLYCGARVVMEPKFNAGSVWSKLLNLNSDVFSRVNIFMAVPTIYAKLIEEYENNLETNIQKKELVKQICLENIRLMVSGSAALPEPILDRWREITGHTLLERYGMTEIGMALTNPLEGERVPGYVGNPFPGVEAKIVQFSPKKDSYKTLCEGNSSGTVVKSGCKEQAGELLIKGPNVFREYWQRPEATEKEFTEDGWFCTGDTAVYKDGNYKILGRSSVDIIKSGGFKVSALDVERHLLSHPNISDVAVVGVEDLTWGEKIAAAIVLKGTSTLDLGELRSWAKERLPHYQVPSVVKIIEGGLPRNNMGKVNKKELRNKYFGQK